MKSFYIPKGITDDYCYIVPGNGYFDVYNTNYLNSNQTYTYYRFYNSVDSDMYQELSRTTGYTGTSLNAIQVVPQHNYFYRQDYKDIVVTAAVLIIGIVVLVNIITSIIKKGGVLSGLL